MIKYITEAYDTCKLFFSVILFYFWMEDPFSFYLVVTLAMISLLVALANVTLIMVSLLRSMVSLLRSKKKKNASIPWSNPNRKDVLSGPGDIHTPRMGFQSFGSGAVICPGRHFFIRFAYFLLLLSLLLALYAQAKKIVHITEERNACKAILISNNCFLSLSSFVDSAKEVFFII